ncbi:MAG: DUF58 domain-containing protein [Lachnospiraceae bacterium]|nr:DUF58 domain-containing protein [Lachnospiraceae bacterium]
MIFLVFVVILVYVLYQAYTYHYRKHWKENFEVKVEFSEEQAGVGDQLFLYETAVNNKKMSLPAICVKFLTSKYLRFEDGDSGTVSDHFYRNDVMSVDGFQKVRRKLRFTCKKRGMYTIDEAELVSFDLFCSHTFVHKLEVSASLCVYPSLLDVSRLIPVFSQMNGGVMTKVPLFEDPYAFAGVREYTPQDSMRRIHWKASARTGEWQVKTMEYHSSTPVVIMLNLESPGVFTNMDLMEDSIRIAYSLVYYLCSNGIQTRLVAAGDEKVRLEGRGRDQISAVRRALAVISYKDVCCNGVELLSEEEGRFAPGMQVIFISPAGKKPLQEQVLRVLRSGIPVTWVAPIITSNSEDSEFRELSPALEKCLVKWGGI